MEYDYEKDIKINKDDLRQECENQPLLLMKYSKLKGQSSKDLQHAEESLALLKGQLTKQIIADAPKKPLVAEIEAEILNNPKYKEAKKKVIDAEYEDYLLKQCISGFQHRKSMIQETIKLLNMNYFSAVEVKQTNSKQIDQSKVSENSRTRVNRKRRKSE